VIPWVHMGEPTPVYRALRSLARAALGLFYRHIEVTGLEHVDPSAPTILASTHPNSIVDPLLVGLSEHRQVNYLDERRALGVISWV
jgi:glycerol-3-phosphate O-acyltransferase / dihydroxyacetone phosphate acyltransferase